MELPEGQGASPTEDRPTKKVALLGFAESYKEAPFDDPTVEMWGLNELHKYVPRWDRWFEVHDADTLGVSKRDPTDGEQRRHLEWLRAQPAGKPIYMQPQFCDGRFPAAVPYPLERMCDRFGAYFTSTIGYMLALAIADGYDWIGLFGIDLASDIEYQDQRPNAEYLVGLARGLGRTVVVSQKSAMLRGACLYGFEKPIQDNKLLSAMLAHRKMLEDKRDQAIATLNTLDGAIQEVDNVKRYYDYTARGCVIEKF